MFNSLIFLFTKCTTIISFNVNFIQVITNWLKSMQYPKLQIVCFFVCLIFFVQLENFSLIWRRRLLWSLSSEGSLNFCDTGQSSPRTRDIRTYCRSFGTWTVTTCFYDLCLSQLIFEHPTIHLRGKRSSPLRHSCGYKLDLLTKKIFSKFGYETTSVT